MKTKLHYALLLMFLLSLISLYPILADFTSVNLNVSDRGVAFSLMRQTASSFFSVSISDIEPYQPVSQPTQAFPLLFIAAETKQPPAVIYQKKAGRGWGKTAKEMGLPANSHGKYMSQKHKQKYSSVLVMSDADFIDVSTIRFLSEYYAADTSLITYWYNRGLSYEDLFIGINLATRLNKQPGDFFKLRTSGKSWEFIAGRYNISYATLSQPVSPRKKMIVTKNSSKPEKGGYFDSPGKGKGKKK